MNILTVIFKCLKGHDINKLNYSNYCKEPIDIKYNALLNTWIDSFTLTIEEGNECKHLPAIKMYQLHTTRCRPAIPNWRLDRYGTLYEDSE